MKKQTSGEVCFWLLTDIMKHMIINRIKPERKYMSVLTLHDLPVRERPRERLVENGVSALSSTEILALILGRGVQGEPVMKLAERLLSIHGSLAGISSASLEDLQQIKGVGVAKACQLQACAEVSRRMSQDVLVRNS